MILLHSRLTRTEAAPSPTSLTVMKPGHGTPAGGLALALQLKEVLSVVLRGSKVRVLLNDSLEPVTEEMVTLASPLDNGVFPLSQVTSVSVIATLVSVARLMEMEQVSVRGAMLPANSGRGGTVMIILGVETGRKDDLDNVACYTHV